MNDFLKEVLRLSVPSKIQNELKLKKINSKFGTNKRIRSVMVSTEAVLDRTTEIAKDVFIGEYTCVGRHTYIQRGTEVLSATIGNFCSIGTNCHIGMYEHPLRYTSTSSRLYLDVIREREFYNDIPNPVMIGNDVWVGSNSTILGGVRIGDGAVIGAGAVVTKDVAPYSVVGGVPAKLIKYRFAPKKIEELLELKWWNWDDETIIKNKQVFINTDDIVSE